ncbi:dihydrolipoamide acetyltransferase family protein [Stagnihabitans tardus]|uniref:Dihydrolipoamide acetyltransferase component of pyruvate dehydrogenase complex n=1 Tax=Stagnihabitans tardus TaxID=2699202 RepID=A0AAE4YCC6_9RHOB|nr:dihydrolipoamide acetyltransferase family protein [Stagnihabitans tardus]NBZ89394.1 biotin/lipoyl-binding protein [Stagnihabitans tardus]
MAKPILVPQVGQDLTEGQILEINVKVGDKVKKGDIVATVESEKAAFEVEAFAEGTVLKVCYAPGDWGKVLEPLLWVGEAGESLGEAAPEPVAAVSGAEVAAPVALVADGALRSSPLARRLAALGNLDLATVKGSGPRGAIVRRDVDKALAAKPAAVAAPVAAPAPVTAPAPAAARPALMAAPDLPAMAAEDVEVPHSRMRQVIADRLLASKQNIPHFYLQAEVDVTDVTLRRKAFNEAHAARITVNDVLVKCVALTLMEHRGLNVHVGPDRILRKGAINIGVAVSVPDGLMVPVLAEADKMDLMRISSETRALADAARRGVSKSTAKGTFSISNLGMFGVDVFPIINPPEAAILGVGPAVEQVRPLRGGLHIRQIMKLTLSADHRAVDGAMAAGFLARLVQVIEDFRFE